MAFEKPILIQTFTAASTMSAASQQFILVKLDSSADAKCHPCTAVTDIPIGVLQNLPAVGELAEVMVLGVSKVRVGATDLSAGVQICTDTTSRAAVYTPGTTSSNAYNIGRVISLDATDNDAALVTCLVNCINLNRAL